MVSPQCAAAGVSSVDHSGQMPSHNLGSHTDKVSLLKERGGGGERYFSGNSIDTAFQLLLHSVAHMVKPKAQHSKHVLGH